MQKIERFRFIDDSASSTTTVTSPVESLEREHTRAECSHLITSAIEQFDDYVQTRYHPNNTDDDEVNSLIDSLNADLLTNGSYSDLNILNHHSSTKRILRPQTFKPVNDQSFQTIKVSEKKYSSLNFGLLIRRVCRAIVNQYQSIFHIQRLFYHYPNNEIQSITMDIHVRWIFNRCQLDVI